MSELRGLSEDLEAALRALDGAWSQTFQTWREPKAAEFDERVLSRLRADLRGAAESLRGLDGAVDRVRSKLG
jgi:hypothetical protein